MGAGKGHGAADFLFPAKSRFPVNRSIFLQIASQTCRFPLEKLNSQIPHSSRFNGLGRGKAGSPSNFLSRIGGECRSGNIFGFERGGRCLRGLSGPAGMRALPPYGGKKLFCPPSCAGRRGGLKPIVHSKCLNFLRGFPHVAKGGAGRLRGE